MTEGINEFLPCPECDHPLHPSRPCEGLDGVGCEGEDCPICDGCRSVWYDDATPMTCQRCGVVSRVKVVDLDEVYAEEVKT